MEVPLVTVPEWRQVGVVGGQRPHTEFHVQCHDRKSGQLIGDVWRRYREFEELSVELDASGFPHLCLPPKWRLPGVRHGFHGIGVDLEKRRAALEKALKQYLAVEEDLPQLLSAWFGIEAFALASANLPDEDLSTVYTFIGARRGSDGSSVDSESACSSQDNMEPILEASTEANKKKLETPGIQARQWPVDFESLFKESELKLCSASMAALVLLMTCLPDLFEPSSMVFLRGALFGSFVTLLFWLAAHHRHRHQGPLAKSRHMIQRRTDLKPTQHKTTTQVGLPDDPASLSSLIRAPSITDTESMQTQKIPPTLTPAMEAEVTLWLDTLMLNAREDVNFQGQPWQHKSSSKGVDIFCSDISGSSRKVWKSRCTVLLQGTGSDLRRHILHWPYRLAWDPSFSDGETLCTSGSYDLVSSRSHAQGPVSAREFVDIRSGRDLPDGSIAGVSVGVAKSQIPEWPYPNLKKGVLRAEVQPGSGFLCKPLPPFPDGSDEACKGQSPWQVEFVGNVDLKGWLSPKIINLAMASSMTNTCVGMMKYFASTDCSAD